MDASWHVEIAEQRNLENARVLWLRYVHITTSTRACANTHSMCIRSQGSDRVTGIRFVEKNRRDVEEKSELLKAIQQIGALFTGLAHVALTQLVVNPPGSKVSSREAARKLRRGWLVSGLESSIYKN